jgi:hypothetical protein
VTEEPPDRPESLQRLNEKASSQATWMRRLTWGIVGLTLVMASGLGALALRMMRR